MESKHGVLTPYVFLKMLRHLFFVLSTCQIGDNLFQDTRLTTQSTYI